jgi:DNA helicase-2/ATP-dependent DNA helicase PcrA
MFNKESGIIKIDRPKGKSNINFEKELDDEQIKPVMQLTGPVLVMAGAGSGKTRVLTYRVANLINHGNENILLLTFTNKSAKDMMKRVESIVGNVPIGLTGGTYHSIGNRALRRHASLLGLQKNYTNIDEEDVKTLMKMAIAELEIDVTETRIPKTSIIKEILSLSINKKVTINNIIREDFPEFYSVKEEIVNIINKYEELKRKNNLIDFNDILVYWHKLLSEHESIRKRYADDIYKYILVDEFQDTNYLQFDIVKLLAGEEQNIMVVGDPNQSIYRWRGAEIENIINFSKHFPNCETFSVGYNYRSIPEILNFANHSISYNKKKSDVLLKSVKESGEKPYIIQSNSSEDEASFIAQRILQLHDEGIVLKDIGILYRAHYLVKNIEIELTKRNIPYDIRSGARFFEQKHTKDVISFIKIIHNNRDEIAWHRIVGQLEGIGAKTAKTIIDNILVHENPLDYLKNEKEFKFIKRGKPAWLKLVEVFNKISEFVAVDDLIRHFIKEHYEEYAKHEFENYKDRLNDIYSLIEFSTKYNDVSTFLEEITLLDQIYEKNNTEGNNEDKDKVTLTTIHKSKGLEWKYIFVIGCGDSQFPSSSSMKDPEELEEERRLFYVACTRAEKELYITYASRAFSFETSTYRSISPSMFIQEINDPGLFQFYTIQ